MDIAITSLVTEKRLWIDQMNKADGDRRPVGVLARLLAGFILVLGIEFVAVIVEAWLPSAAALSGCC